MKTQVLELVFLAAVLTAATVPIARGDGFSIVTPRWRDIPIFLEGLTPDPRPPLTVGGVWGTIRPGLDLPGQPWDAWTLQVVLSRSYVQSPETLGKRNSLPAAFA